MLSDRTHEKVQTTVIDDEKMSSLHADSLFQFFIKQVYGNTVPVCEKKCRQKFCKW